jgi:hypothetical protein
MIFLWTPFFDWQKHMMFGNKVWSILATSFYHFKFRVYNIQLVFKYYGPDYNNYPEPYQQHKQGWSYLSQMVTVSLKFGIEFI